MKRGYARVSTLEQDLGRQIQALQQYGCEVIYTDKISGLKASRPDLDRMRKDLQSGDIVVIQKLDRLGRSMIDLVNLIKEFTAKEVTFVSLTDNFDTTTSVGLLSFHIIAAFAQFERDMISERTADALKHAKSKGIKVGRPGCSAEVMERIVTMDTEGFGVSDIAKETKLSRPTIYRILAR